MSLFSRIFGKPPTDGDGDGDADATTSAEGQGSPPLDPPGEPLAPLSPDPFAPSRDAAGQTDAPAHERSDSAVDARFAHWGQQGGDELADPVPPIRTYEVDPGARPAGESSGRGGTEPPRKNSNTPSPTRVHRSDAPPPVVGPHRDLPPADALPSIIVDVDPRVPPKPPPRAHHSAYSGAPPLPSRASSATHAAVGGRAPSPPGNSPGAPPAPTRAAIASARENPFSKTMPLSPPSRPALPAVSGAVPTASKASISQPALPAVHGSTGKAIPPRTTTGSFPAAPTSTSTAQWASAAATPRAAAPEKAVQGPPIARAPAASEQNIFFSPGVAAIASGESTSAPTAHGVPPESSRSIVMSPEQLQSAMDARRQSPLPEPTSTEPIPPDASPAPPLVAATGDLPPLATTHASGRHLAPPPPSSTMEVSENELEADDDDPFDDTGPDELATMILARAPNTPAPNPVAEQEMEEHPLDSEDTTLSGTLAGGGTGAQLRTVPSFAVDDVDVGPPLSDLPASTSEPLTVSSNPGITANDSASLPAADDASRSDDLAWPSSGEWGAASPLPTPPPPQAEEAAPPPFEAATIGLSPRFDEVPASTSGTAITRPPEDPQYISEPPETPMVVVPTVPTLAASKALFDGAELADLVRTTEERFVALTDPLDTTNFDAGAAITEDARALFVALARLSAKHVRAFVYELRRGPASADWLSLTSACCTQLRAGADQFELHELSRLVGEFSASVERASERGVPTVDGAIREEVLAAFAPLVENWSEVFALADGEDPGQEGIVVQSLLAQVDDVRKVTLSRLFAAGLMTLEGLLAARPNDLVDTSGIDLDTATRIVARLTSYKRELDARTEARDARAFDVDRLRECAATLRAHHAGFEAAVAASDSQGKKTARAARELALSDVRIVAARIGATDLLSALERAAFAEKLDRITEWLAAGATGTEEALS